jgi:hypothetical protein
MATPSPEQIRAACPRGSTSFLQLNGLLPVKSTQVHLAAPAKPSIRSPKKKGSKTQTAFVEYLKLLRNEGTVILEEQITLEIAAGCRYTADVFVYEPPIDNGGTWRSAFLVAYEVKGPHAWDDAIVKLKVAARAYPWIKFFLVRREPSEFGGWFFQRVEP